MTAPRTLFDKIWDEHLVETREDGTSILYIDRHLVHEVTSPQAFEVCATLAARSAAPTRRWLSPITTCRQPTVPRVSRTRKAASRSRPWRRTAPTSTSHTSAWTTSGSIVHIIGPEQGFTQPGATIVCGDSQHRDPRCVRRACLWHRHFRGRARTGHPVPAAAQVEEHAYHGRGRPAARRDRQDLILAIIGVTGTAGGTGYVIQYAGSAIRNLSMEGRGCLPSMSCGLPRQIASILDDSLCRRRPR